MNCSRTKECIDEYVKAISADLQETGEEGASSARAQDNTAEASAGECVFLHRHLGTRCWLGTKMGAFCASRKDDACRHFWVSTCVSLSHLDIYMQKSGTQGCTPEH